MLKIDRIAIASALAITFTLLVLPSASAVGPGKKCGGFVGIPCDAGLFCQLPPGNCKSADMFGKCVKVPTICTKIFRPVCGCDGKTYGNDCERQAAKVQKDHNGRCKQSKY